MGRVLGQLFEVTARFQMALRPELVLLQKTMATIEGVARRIDPDHDIWAAADPVVRRWIGRELSPAAKMRRLVKDGIDAIQVLARYGLYPPSAQAPRMQKRATLAYLILGLTLGCAMMALGFMIARTVY
jgi:ubiquinone biosynthesis protein